jgi:curved DNA-binding protein
MAALPEAMTFKRARELLGVPPQADQAQVREAYRAAVKRVHPDRPGGDADAFREVVAAYERLRLPKTPDRIVFPPATAQPRPPQPIVLEISPLLALTGGSIDHSLKGGRKLRITLPAGMRARETIQAGGVTLTIFVRGERGVIVRGDDLWLTVEVESETLTRGGRIAVDTPLGRRIIWITQKAGERRLVRLPGQGLPARGDRRQGHMFLRLAPKTETAESPARNLLRRFAAAWAA